MSEWFSGNALIDGEPHRGWLIGHFIEDEELRRSENVEIKWAFHPAGDEREAWVTGEVCTTILILISGKFEILLSNEIRELANQGDYAMWGPGIDHKWRAIEDSVMLTVRWPSLQK